MLYSSLERRKIFVMGVLCPGMQLYFGFYYFPIKNIDRIIYLMIVKHMHKMIIH